MILAARVVAVLSARLSARAFVASGLASALAVATTGALVACSDAHDDHAHHDEADEGEGVFDGPASCQAFHDACVLAEGASEKADACHALTHRTDLTETLCAAEKDACVAACGAAPLADGGAAGEGG